MELCVLQSLPYLTIEGIPKTGLHLDDDYWIGTDLEYVDALANSRFRAAAGSLETDHTAGNPAYAHVTKRYASGKMEQADGLAYLHVFLTKTQLLLLALWMVKDNSANGTAAYLRLDDESGPHFLSETRTTYFFMADCELRTVGFTEDEFRRAVAYYRQFDSVIPKVPYKERRISGLVHESRVARTLYFVQAARNSSDLAVKIAFYCMCFESLFSTDKAGVSHRVSERTAVFLGSTGDAKREIYRDVHRLYAIRSSTVHGSRVKLGEIPEVIELTKRGDDHLRRCLTTILGEAALLELVAKGSSEKLDEHFVGKLFPT